MNTKLHVLCIGIVSLLFLQSAKATSTLVKETTTTITTFSSIIYIDKDATGNNDGSSWQNAYTDISNAISNAPNNAEVWIKGGTYIPNVSGNTSIGISVFATGIKIYGGFAGTETQLSERIIGANETIITGDVNGNDAAGLPAFTQFDPTTTDNIGTLIGFSEFSTTEKTILDGITFTRSYAQTGVGTMFLSGENYPNLRIQNCRFAYNLHDQGGAIYSNYLLNFLSQFGNGLGIEIDQCVFDHNVARIGAGIYIANQDDSSTQFVTASIQISNTLFNNNVATDDPTTTQGFLASAVRIFQGDPQSVFTTNIINNTFTNNKEFGTLLPANERYVVTLESPVPSYQNATLANNIFWDNETSGNAIASSVGGASGFTANITMFNNLGEDNFSNIPAGQQTNTLNIAPQFTDAANQNFTLQSTSPAINSGDNSYVTTAEDLLGNSRIVSSVVDLGAYEYDASLSVAENVLAGSEVLLYPNPVASMVTIETETAVKKIVIYTMLGKAVLETNSKTIDVSSLSQGMYILKITSDNGGELTKRFIKQ